MKRTIKSLYGRVLFESSKEKSSLKETLMEAVSCGVDLSNAYLSHVDLTKVKIARAKLFHADLSNSNLGGSDLNEANLGEANLSNSNVCSVDMRNVNLTKATLSQADLYGSNLTGANLLNADLSFADFSNATVSLKALEGAKLFHTDLHDAYFSKNEIVDVEKFKRLFWIVPEEGSFVAWKKGSNHSLIKIEIPAEAKRTSNIRNRMGRAEFVNVLAIYDEAGNEIESTGAQFNPTFIYKSGIIHPDSYDDNWTIDCAHGIHFFLTKGEAINYL